MESILAKTTSFSGQRPTERILGAEGGMKCRGQRPRHGGRRAVIGDPNLDRVGHVFRAGVGDSRPAGPDDRASPLASSGSSYPR